MTINLYPYSEVCIEGEDLKLGICTYGPRVYFNAEGNFFGQKESVEDGPYVEYIRADLVLTTKE